MSTMVSLQDFLKDIKTNYQQDMDKAREGVASGAWDGPPLPLELEYRVEVEKGEYAASKRGPMQLSLTYVITEPAEYAGRKLQEYYQPDPGNEIAQRKLSELIGALGASLDGLGSEWAELAKRFEGSTGVIALRVWGDENDRYGVRWINSDRGQTLKTNVKPPKPKGGTGKSLRPDVNINKGEPFPASQPAPAAPAAPAEQSLPGAGARPAGAPNLPPGLR